MVLSDQKGGPLLLLFDRCCSHGAETLCAVACRIGCSGTDLAFLQSAREVTNLHCLCGGLRSKDVMSCLHSRRTTTTMR